MKKLIIPSVVILLFVTACGNKKSKTKAVVSATKTDTFYNNASKQSAPPLVSKIDSAAGTKDFTVNVPAGWIQKENEMNGYKMFFLMAPKTGSFQSNLNILKDKMTEKNLDDYIGNNLKKLAAMQVKEIRQSELNVNGLKGKSISYLYKYQGTNLAIKTYVLPANAAVYILTTTCPVGDAKQLEPVFSKIVDSFKVK